MRLVLPALLVLIAGSAVAAPAPQGPCAEGFLPRGRAPEAIYLCAGPKLACRKDWSVDGADTAPDRVRSYECKPEITRLSAMTGATPATCAERFLPRPSAVRDAETYRCHAVDAHIETPCSHGYAPGGLTLSERPLADANRAGAATRRRLDGAQLAYVCMKQ